MIEQVRILREKTNAGIMDCKSALKEAKGDIEKAIEVLRKRGKALASKKVGRVTKEGCVESYIHFGGKIGVLVEIGCETDFVARNDEFKTLARNIAMQIAAAKPSYLAIDDIPKEILEKEKEIIREEVLSKEKERKKIGDAIDKIIENKLQKFYEENCLLEQPFIKDQKLKVRDVIEQHIASLGENIVVRRFTRYQLGEEG